MIIRQASGIELTKGETFGHAGTQLWRDWISLEDDIVDSVKEEKGGGERNIAKTVALTKPTDGWLEQFHNRDLDGHAVDLNSKMIVNHDHQLDEIMCSYLVKPDGKLAISRLGLVLPTSLCSSQVCAGIVDKLNAALDRSSSTKNRAAYSTNTNITEVARYLSLQHSEGCGVGATHGSEQVEQRILVGHLTHSSIDSSRAVLLEHGNF
jgi:hypothetical protein